MRRGRCGSGAGRGSGSGGRARPRATRSRWKSCATTATATRSSLGCAVRAPCATPGSISCFAPALWRTVSTRAAERPAGSYTTELLDAGTGACARKVGEEAVELAVAALDEEDARVVEEAADLIYHLYVLLASRGIDLAQVEECSAIGQARDRADEQRAKRRPGRSTRRCARRRTPSPACRVSAGRQQKHREDPQPRSVSCSPASLEEPCGVCDELRQQFDLTGPPAREIGTCSARASAASRRRYTVMSGCCQSPWVWQRHGA